MIHFLQKFSNWRSIVPLLILFVVFSSYFFPAYQVRRDHAASGKVEPLDLRFGYDYQEVLHEFNVLGVGGRAVYRIMVGKIDMAYPVVYGPLVIMVLAFLLKRAFPDAPAVIVAALFPVLTMGFDYLENANTLRLLTHFPDFSPEDVARGAWFTMLKHITLAGCLVGAASLSVVLLLKKVRKMRGNL